MTYCVLDAKEECFGIYKDGELYFNEEVLKESDWTWKPTPNITKKQDKYASLLCNGKSLNDACPEQIKEQWERVNKKLRAFMQSFVEAKIDLEDNCFYDLVPKRFLLEYCELKCQIINKVVNDNRIKNYNHLLETSHLLAKISKQDLNVDLTELRTTPTQQAQRFYKNIKNITPIVKYNQFGTVTGRLTTIKGSFPILNMPRKFRSIIKPQNKVFLELDFNAAELRVLLALSGQEQPDTDVHAYNAEVLGVSRDEAKENFFAWLYGSQQIDGTFFVENYDTNLMMEKLGTKSTIETPFGRTIESDERHKLNYLIQSTTSDMVLEQAHKLQKLMSNFRSHISFIMHDSVIIDFHEEERELLQKAINSFRDTRFGLFKINVFLGKDYGNMKKVEM